MMGSTSRQDMPNSSIAHEGDRPTRGEDGVDRDEEDVQISLARGGYVVVMVEFR